MLILGFVSVISTNSLGEPKMQEPDESARPPGLYPLDFLKGLVEQIAKGDRAAMDQLYLTLINGLRAQLNRQLPPDLAEDRAHNVFVVAVKAILSGQLRDPARLPAFIRTVAQRQIADAIRSISRARSVELDSGLVPLPDLRDDPEQELAQQQKLTCLRSALASLSPRDREILTRFYLDEQDAERICGEMNLTPTQFRLFKSRAKGRLTEAARQGPAPTGLPRRFAKAC
jgi:RNA polymerase sigma-70 factor, ECF subfamily